MLFYCRLDKIYSCKLNYKCNICIDKKFDYIDNKLTDKLFYDINLELKENNND